MQHLTLPQSQVWFDEQLLTEDPRLCFEPDFWQQQNAVIGSAQGRGTTWFVRGEKADMALRHYRRGGLFGKLVADAYWFTGWQHTRSYQEFMLLQKLAQGGVNVPRPVAARAIKSGLTYQADILVEKVADAQDLVASGRRRLDSMLAFGVTTVEGKSGSAAVRVRQAVATVEISGGRDSLDALGDTTRFLATAKDSRGNTIAGEDASWSSSAPCRRRDRSAIRSGDPRSIESLRGDRPCAMSRWAWRWGRWSSPSCAGAPAAWRSRKR